MAKESSIFLDTNDLFPHVTWQLVSGDLISLPEVTGEQYGIVLLYRGNW